MRLKIFLFTDYPSEFEDTEEFEQKTIEENGKNNLYDFVTKYKDNKCCIFEELEIEDIKDYLIIKTFVYGHVIKNIISLGINIYEDFFVDYTFINIDGSWKYIYNNC